MSQPHDEPIAEASPEEVAAERDERLDPDHRPQNAEVDNTDREFDAEKAMFTDAEGYDEAPAVFPPVEEQDT
ncbi:MULTISPECIES: hypothetical protein [unclassified Nocardioides]|uniref:hypothetical protein n=1 Tax=unclassified Nocardioides TaxID=2615069 RepID=UPI000703385A|nr:MULTISPECIES: hypothetical protein [unclassified Nocardioides]KQP63338.1 hypothetical protein ASF47_14605 [Nocardioides sp. Leaf285]KQQ39718.1 hypothetical protein ASF50_17815 [Nocardioides sp. Leaf307]